jgi:hypothetical protein
MRLCFAVLAGLLLATATASPEEAGDPAGDEKETWPREEEIEHLRAGTAYVLDAGELEVNLVAEFLRFRNDERKSRDVHARAELEYGITDRLMAEVEYTYLFLRPEGGGGTNRPGDIEVEAKYLFLDLGDFAAAAGLSAGSVVEWEPEEDEIERNYAVEGFGAVSWTPCPDLCAHVTAGLEAVRHEAPERFVSAALEYIPFGREVVLQVGLTSEAEGSRSPETALGPGIFLRLEEPEIRIGVGVPIGLSERAPDWAVLVNLEIELE